MEATIKQIEAVLDAKVRPSLAEHNGNVVIQSLENNILRVRLTGKCSGCPSIQDVILVEEINPELLDMAHKILSHQI